MRPANVFNPCNSMWRRHRCRVLKTIVLMMFVMCALQIGRRHSGHPVNYFGGYQRMLLGALSAWKGTERDNVSMDYTNDNLENRTINATITDLSDSLGTWNKYAQNGSRETKDVDDVFNKSTSNAGSRQERGYTNKTSYIRDSTLEAGASVHMMSSTTPMPSTPNKKPYLFESVKDIEILVQTEKHLSTYLFNRAEKNYIFNCSNIQELKLDKKVGHGFFKETYKGTFRGQTVAVKVPRVKFTGLERCVNTMFGRLKVNTSDQVSPIINALFSKCSTWVISNMIRETMNHVVFNYPSIARNLGYCVLYETRDDVDTILQHPGIVSVYEYGSPFSINTLKALPWRHRVSHCRDLANLFEMFEFSILGSVVYYDFRMRHFKMINGRITIIDMDDWVSPVEPRCGGKLRDIPPKLLEHKRIRGNYNQMCQYNVRCTDFVCNGVNAKYNIHHLTDYFLTPLLSEDSLPSDVYSKYKHFIDGIQTYTYNARGIKQWLDRILNEFETDIS